MASYAHYVLTCKYIFDSYSSVETTETSARACHCIYGLILMLYIACSCSSDVLNVCIVHMPQFLHNKINHIYKNTFIKSEVHVSTTLTTLVHLLSMRYVDIVAVSLPLTM